MGRSRVCEGRLDAGRPSPWLPMSVVEEEKASRATTSTKCLEICRQILTLSRRTTTPPWCARNDDGPARKTDGGLGEKDLGVSRRIASKEEVAVRTDGMRKGKGSES